MWHYKCLACAYSFSFKISSIDHASTLQWPKAFRVSFSSDFMTQPNNKIGISKNTYLNYVFYFEGTRNNVANLNEHFEKYWSSKRSLQNILLKIIAITCCFPFTVCIATVYYSLFKLNKKNDTIIVQGIHYKCKFLNSQV